MPILMKILAAIVVLGPLVALHELGHYAVARFFGVKVLTYSIGFGPQLLKWQSKKSGIMYQISAIPLGGYVRMLDGREGDVKEEEKHLAFDNQNPWKKIAIVAAGPVTNLIIAILLYWVLFLPVTENFNTRIGQVLDNSPAAKAGLVAGEKIESIDGESVSTWQEVNYALADRMGETGVVNVVTTTLAQANQPVKTQTHTIQISTFLNAEGKKDALESIGFLPWQPHIEPIISELAKDGAAIRQGMQVGDRITAIDGTTVDDWLTVKQIVATSPEKLLTFDVLRQGQPVHLNIMPQGKKDNMGNAYGQIGAQVKVDKIEVPAAYKQTIHYTPSQALVKAVEKTSQLTAMTLSAMGKMVSGLIGLNNLSGPLTIAVVAEQTFSISWQAVVDFMAIISLSLAVLNLLPIPVLDGGHMLYYFIEAITGKPLPESAQMVGFNIGLLLLAGLMVLAIGNDISRLL